MLKKISMLRFKSILFLSFLFFTTSSFAQLKVFQTGDIGVNNTTNTPRAYFDINRHDTRKALGQFGTFGIQSFSAGNGFLSNNGHYTSSGGKWIAKYDGQYVNAIQFSGSFLLFKTSPNRVTTAGESVLDADMKIALVTNASGYVGINGAFPGVPLQVNGHALKTSGGDLWSIPSDQRLKSNPKQFSKGLDYIMRMNPVEYVYNGKGGTTKGERQIGVMAQELQKIAPFMVEEFNYEASSLTPNGEKNSEPETFLSINASAVKWMLVAAVKQQQEIIKKLEDKINTLEQQIGGNTLEDRLSRLEEKIKLESANHKGN